MWLESMQSWSIAGVRLASCPAFSLSSGCLEENEGSWLDERRFVGVGSTGVVSSDDASVLTASTRPAIVRLKGWSVGTQGRLDGRSETAKSIWTFCSVLSACTLAVLPDSAELCCSCLTTLLSMEPFESESCRHSVGSSVIDILSANPVDVHCCRWVDK